MKSQSSPESIPAAFAKSETLSSVYRSGWNHGHGFACHNVPTLGAKLFVEDMGRVTVDADNVREVHQSLCYSAASNSRQFSPFEFTASELNGLEDGGFAVIDPDGNEVARFDAEDDAKAELSKLVANGARESGISEDEAREGWAIKDMPSADEAWEAYEQGEADAIAADLATYTDADYGIESDGKE